MKSNVGIFYGNTEVNSNNCMKNRVINNNKR